PTSREAGVCRNSRRGFRSVADLDVLVAPVGVLLHPVAVAVAVVVVAIEVVLAMEVVLVAMVAVVVAGRSRGRGQHAEGGSRGGGKQGSTQHLFSPFLWMAFDIRAFVAVSPGRFIALDKIIIIRSAFPFIKHSFIRHSSNRLLC